MFEDLKKKSFKKSLWASIFLIIAGLALIGWDAMNFWYAVTGYVTFEDLAPDQIRNQLVDVELTANFGCYLEEYEYNSETRYKKTTHLYYIIWTGDENAVDYRYMTLKVPPSYEKQLEAMAENTYNQILSDPISISGKIKKLSNEDYGYFKDYFTEDGSFTVEEFEAMTLPYYIDLYGSKASMNSVYIILFAGGILLLAIGIFRVVKGAGGGYLKKLHEDITNAGYTENVVESDYASAESFDKKDELKIGRLMTYYTIGAQTRAFPNNKVIWTYQSTITHRTNGIKTGTTYNVIFFIEGYKNEITLAVSDEAASQKILQKINTIFPWVVVGYSDELKKMYQKNREQFLQLRYNTCQHIPVEPDMYGRTPINPGNL